MDIAVTTFDSCTLTSNAGKTMPGQETASTSSVITLGRKSRQNTFLIICVQNCKYRVIQMSRMHWRQVFWSSIWKIRIRSEAFTTEVHRRKLEMFWGLQDE